MVKILQWNGKCVISNKRSLEKYIFDNNLKIALLCLTWFKKNHIIDKVVTPV